MQPDLRFLPIPIPVHLTVLFALLVLLLLFGLYYLIRPVSRKKTPVILAVYALWLSFLYFLAEQSFFLKVNTVPPPFLAAVLPPLLFITFLFISEKGRRFIDQLSLQSLTWIHTVRVGVELLLYALFLARQIPQMMTFEGRNWDILAGLTAPLLVFMTFRRKQQLPHLLLWWNILALGLLINIVATAVLSAPFQWQQLNFEQPNVGVLKSTFIWLPGFVVPVVLFSHLAALRQLRK
ncbi:MAG: hypothetical protein U0X91_16080 [Spirosomataceae bacterium]